MTFSLSRLQTFYGHLDAKELLNAMIKHEFNNQIAVVSSFGAGSIILLSLIAEVDTNTKVIFLDTQKHFPETLEYVETVKKILKLTNVKILKPREDLLLNSDPEGKIWQTMPNRCCWLRKVQPLEAELKASNIKALITGRKRYQTQERQEMQTIELNDDGIFRINPLANWTKEDLANEFKSKNLVEHSLFAKGYLSIGCQPCTRPVKQGEDERAGRWAHTAQLPGGEQKSECGIHIQENNPQKPDWNI